MSYNGDECGGYLGPSPCQTGVLLNIGLEYKIVFNTVRLFTPLLAKAGTQIDPARVVIVGSTGGSDVPHVGDNSTIVYAASKAAAHVYIHVAY